MRKDYDLNAIAVRDARGVRSDAAAPKGAALPGYGERSAEMARAADDTAFADELDRMGDAGARALNTTLYNGEYFIQSTDLGDRTLIEQFDKAKGKVGVLADHFMETYWSDE